MCSRKDWFDDFQHTTPSKIHLADGRTISATGKGTIDFYTKIENDMHERSLVDVLYVPELRGNLISVNKAVAQGNKVCFEDGECIISNKVGTVAIAERRNNLYQIKTIKIPN